MIVVYPGSFDPITYGHLDVVGRGAALFDRVVVAVARNESKAGLLPVDERLRLVRLATADLPGVEVAEVPGLLADFCRERGAGAILKGLRSGVDLASEMPQAVTNRVLGGPETLFLTSSAQVAHISSTIVREVARHGGALHNLVPPCVAEVLTSLADDVRREAPTRRGPPAGAAGAPWGPATSTPCPRPEEKAP